MAKVVLWIRKITDKIPFGKSPKLKTKKLDMSMKIDDFISEAITGIFKGIVDTEAKCTKLHTRGGHCGAVSPSRVFDNSSEDQNEYAYVNTVQNIEFEVDVAVSYDSNKNATIGIVGGAVGIGGKLIKKKSNTSSNKIKFTIPVFLPHSGQVNL